MSKARTLANFVSSGNPLADGAIAASEVTGLSTVATTGAYADLSGKPTLGTAAAQNTGTFLQTANNLSDVTAATARTNLGLATVAATGSYNDLSNKPTITTTATNIAGGSNGTIPYQSAEGTTQMLAVGTAGQVLTSNGAAAPTWATPAPGAGTVTAVASGSLSDGTKVVLNSDGTVSAVVATAGAYTSYATMTPVSSGNGTSGRFGFSIAYSTTDDRFLLVWVGQSSIDIYGAVGKLNGSTITFGTTTALYSGSIISPTYSGVQALYASVSNRIVVSYYRQSDGCLAQTLCSITPSTNSVTVVSTTANGAHSYNYPYFSCCYNPVSNVVLTAKFNSIGYTGYFVTSVSTVGLYQGSFYALEYSSPAQLVSCCYCSGINKFAIAYRNSSNYPVVALGTWDGTSVSFGSENVLNSQTTYTSSYSPMAVAYSPAASQLLVCYTKTGDGYLYAKAGTVSGNSVTFGSEGYMAFIGNNYYPYYGFYDSVTQRILVSNIYGAQAITFPSTNTFSVSASISATVSYCQISISSENGLVYCGGANGSQPNAEVQKGYTTNLTSSNFLGISNSSYTNGQTATIQTVGSTDDAQSSLTPATKYYVTDQGGLSATATTQPYAGLALTSTKLIIKG